MRSPLSFLLLFALALLASACRAPGAVANTETPVDVPPVMNPTATLLAPPSATPTATLPAEQLVDLAQDASNRGEWEVAIALLDLALEQNAENAQAYLLRGNAYKQLRDPNQALSDYNQAITLDVNLAAAFQNRALVHSELGDQQQALADFGRAIELAPTFGLAYRNRAAVHLELGNTAAAALDLQIYLTFVPAAPDRVEVEAQIAELQAQVVEEAAEDGLLFFDDFSDLGSGWYTNGDPASPGIYAGDGYVLQVTQSVEGGATGVWAMAGRLFSDVRVEVTANKQNGTDNNFYGILCRLQGTTQTGSFYAFIVSSDGFYGIAKRVNQGEMRGLGQDKLLPSGLINTGEGSNQLTAICAGDRLAFYVNGELVYETRDKDLANGQVGLIAGTYEATTSIFFDDFAVYTEPAP
jgi:tetratricopeptide (TPR) repeat protein